MFRPYLHLGLMTMSLPSIASTRGFTSTASAKYQTENDLAENPEGHKRLILNMVLESSLKNCSNVIQPFGSRASSQVVLLNDF